MSHFPEDATCTAAPNQGPFNSFLQDLPGACLQWQRSVSTLAALGASTLPPGDASIPMGTFAQIGLGTSLLVRRALPL